VSITCRECVWVKVSKEDTLVTRQFRWNTEDRRLIKLKTPITEKKVIIDYYCTYYREHINDISRAEKCKKYTRPSSLVTLDSYIKGNENIQTSMGFSGKDVL